MRIEKITSSDQVRHDNGSKGEEQRFKSAREGDRKNTEYERFRRDSGVSKEEFKKQAARARKMGFGAIFGEELKKYEK